MKLFLTGLFFVGINLIVHSQITLTIDDLPESGDVQVSARIDSLEDLTLTPGMSGEDIVWDFSMLNYFVSNLDNPYDSTTWVNPINTPNSSFFPQASIAHTTNCYVYHDWISHIISVICYYNYCIIDTNGLQLYGSTYPQLQLHQQYRNIFPLLQYGDTSISVSKAILYSSNDSVIYRTVLDTSVADGWGIVKTPIANYNSLRIYSSETVWDSLFINGNFQQSLIKTGNYYYKWYTKNMGFPVFQISKGILINQPDYQITHFAKYLQKEVGISENKITNNPVGVYPNPFSTEARLVFGNNPLEKFSVFIYDLSLKECFRFENIYGNEIIINRLNIENGLYFFNIIDKDGKIINGKFLIH